MMDRFKKLCMNFWPPVLFGLVVSNFILSCSAFRSASPREFHYYREITNNVVSVSSVSSSSLSPSISTNLPPSDVVRVDPQKPSEFHIPYNFMIVSGSPCMRFYGRYYYEGDVMSRGRIFRIFPDRVFLHTGDVLVNTSFPDVGGGGGVEARPSRRLPSPKISPPDFTRMFNK